MGQKETHALQQTAAYSITSSARSRMDECTSRPSALAVLRLITRSKLIMRQQPVTDKRAEDY
jgi:hypothetical protein